MNREKIPTIKMVRLRFSPAGNKPPYEVEGKYKRRRSRLDGQMMYEVGEYCYPDTRVTVLDKWEVYAP